MNSDRTTGYLLGVVETGGEIEVKTYNDSTKRLVLTIFGPQKIIEWLEEIAGGEIRETKIKGWQWQLSNNLAVEFIEALEPFLECRKNEFLTAVSDYQKQENAPVNRKYLTLLVRKELR